MNRIEIEGSYEHQVLHNINEEEDQSNEDDEGQTFDRVGVNLLTVLLYKLMRCCACEDGLRIQAGMARTARRLRARPQSALRTTRVFSCCSRAMGARTSPGAAKCAGGVQTDAQLALFSHCSRLSNAGTR